MSAVLLPTTTIKEGGHSLIYTGPLQKTYGGADWVSGPDLSANATNWLGEQGISAFGVEMLSPGIPSNF